MRTSMRPSAALLLFLVLCVHGSQTFQLIRNNRLGGYPQPPFAGYPHQVPIYVRSSLDELPAPKPSFWPANQEAPRANEQFSLEIFSVSCRTKWNCHFRCCCFSIKYVCLLWLQEIGQALTRYQDANIVLSPASVWALLTLLAEGATNNTFDELQQTLRLPADLSVLRQEFSQYQNFLTIKTPTVELLAGQALFSDRNQPVDPSYAARLSNDYHADHMPVNFRDANTASSEINSYISLRTGGKINNLIKPEDLTDAHLLLTSTIFFKGKWTVSCGTFASKFCRFLAEKLMNDFLLIFPIFLSLSARSLAVPIQHQPYVEHAILHWRWPHHRQRADDVPTR